VVRERMQLTSGPPGAHTLSGVSLGVDSSALRECVSAPGRPGPAEGRKDGLLKRRWLNISLPTTPELTAAAG